MENKPLNTHIPYASMMQVPCKYHFARSEAMVDEDEFNEFTHAQVHIHISRVA